MSHPARGGGVGEIHTFPFLCYDLNLIYIYIYIYIGMSVCVCA